MPSEKNQKVLSLFFEVGILFSPVHKVSFLLIFSMFPSVDDLHTEYMQIVAHFKELNTSLEWENRTQFPFKEDEADGTAHRRSSSVNYPLTVHKCMLHLCSCSNNTCLRKPLSQFWKNLQWMTKKVFCLLPQCVFPPSSTSKANTGQNCSLRRIYVLSYNLHTKISLRL